MDDQDSPIQHLPPHPDSKLYPVFRNFIKLWTPAEIQFLLTNKATGPLLTKMNAFFHANGISFGDPSSVSFDDWFGNLLAQNTADMLQARSASASNENNKNNNSNVVAETGTDSTMDDPAKRAAIMNFALPTTTPSSSSQSPSTSSTSSSSIAGKTLSSQYNAMMTKRGKKTFPKACEGAAKCKNVLCEHKYAPIGALTQSFGGVGAVEPRDPLIDPKVLALVMAQSKKDGFQVSESYAIKMLQKNDYKLVPAIKDIKVDINAREVALHSTGRVNVAFEHHVQDTCIHDHTSSSSSSSPILPVATPCSPTCAAHTHLNGLPRTRDGFISALEMEDLYLADTLTLGWKSFYGTAIHAARYRTKEQRESAFKVYVDEAKYREKRAAFWKEVVAQKGEDGVALSSDEVEVCMEKWEEVNRGSWGDVEGENASGNGKGEWRKDAVLSKGLGTASSSTVQGAASTSTAQVADSKGITPKTKVYSHPLTEAPIINDDPVSQPAEEELTKPLEADSDSEEPAGDDTTASASNTTPEFSNSWNRRFSDFYRQQEADKARYQALMDSVASDDVKIATLRMQANQLLHENRKLQNINHELKFRATQRLLEEIDDPPEPQIIYDLVTKIADWDLKFGIALGDDELPILYSLELFDLLDKLCKNIYLVSVQTISEEMRPAIRKAWDAINFGGRTFFQAMKLAIIIDIGLMEETLGEKLSKTIEMAMLLDETFKNLDIELPVLKRKDKRNRVEDKKLQGMLSKCLELSMKVCEYPKDLSWRGITKLRYEVGDGVTLQKQMETKYIGLASCDPPTETMNKKNAATYLELIKKARDIDDLLKAKADDPVAKYKQMLGVWYVDKVHPASVLPAWKTLIKDEETHNMIALLMLIAADEEEGKYGQVIQIFREAIHEDLLALHKFVKNDPNNFCVKTNYKFLLDVIGEAGQLKWDDLTDQQIWDWILGFQLAKTRIGGDVKEVLGWAADFEGQKTFTIVKSVPTESQPSVQYTRVPRRIATPRRTQGSLHKALSKNAIEAKIGENETLEAAVERLVIDKNIGQMVDSNTSQPVATVSSSESASEPAATNVDDNPQTPQDEPVFAVPKSTFDGLDATGFDFNSPEFRKLMAKVYEAGVARGKASSEDRATSSEPILSEKAKGKQPARD